MMLDPKKEIVIKWPLKDGGDGGDMWRAPAIPGYRFTHDCSCENYDWLVVYDEFPFGSHGTIENGRELLRCPREHTILLTQEPECLKRYGKLYTHQFGHLITTRPWEAERHPHYHKGVGYYIPCVGRPYDELKLPAPDKTKLISAVCSAKAMKHTQHWQRCNLVRHLAKSISGFDWYGYGVKFIDRKCDGLDAYKYHVAMENVILPGHWTEKISDALLCECLPFYAGDPELGKVLPQESFIPIPLDNPKEAERNICLAIASNEYEKRREAILEAKRLILKEYNLYSQIIAVIESAGDVVCEEDRAKQSIESRHRLRREPKEALLSGWWNLKRELRNLF